MSVFAFLYLVVATSLPGHAVQMDHIDVPPELHPPLAAVYRIAYGLQAEQICQHLTAAQRQDMKSQLSAAARTLHTRMVNAGVSGVKAQRVLVRMMEHGEKLAISDNPACTELAPHIIVKTMRDAACINQYLAGTNTACFNN